MSEHWRQSTWGDEISLEYGKSLRGYQDAVGPYRVFGSNGPIGWAEDALAPGPGIILGRKGAYRGVHFSRNPFFVIDTAYYVKPKSDFDVRWLYYAIIHHKLGEIDDGSPIPSTTRAAVYIQDVAIPPIDEQREIAAVLGALDDKIELNRKTAATLEAMARALYRSWFVDFDPVYAKAEGLAPAHMNAETAALFPDSFGEDGLPEGWEIVPLSEMCEHTKKTVKPMDAPDDAFLHFSLPAFDAGKMPIAEPGAGIKSNKTFVPHNAILFSRLNPTIPRVWWARTKGSDATPASSTEFFIAKAHDQAETSWLYCTLSSDEFREAACARVTGTSNSHQRIPPKALAEIEVIAPSSDVVSAFGDLAGPWFEKVHTMASENQTLAQLRDTLLPRLMSGELRVPAARKQVEEAL
jgi:type I restriction enzyme S subunit